MTPTLSSLFFRELETQVSVFNEQLLILEADGTNVEALDALMRAAHSVKSAARMVRLDDVAALAHAMEEVFVALKRSPQPVCMDPLLSAVDTLSADGIQKKDLLQSHTSDLIEMARGIKGEQTGQAPVVHTTEKKEATIRVSAESLTRLLDLASELIAESHWLHPFSNALREIKNRSILEDFERFSQRHAILSDRLYREVVASRMCPFEQGIEGYPRMVRDLSHQLGKDIRFEISGKTTTVDREIMEKLEAPLHHLLRNAVAHGIESSQERIQAGKPPRGLVRLEACHHGASLEVVVSDDGRGLDFEQIRREALDRKLVDLRKADELSESELTDFLFLPGFSTTHEVSDISGRGIGLNAVREMANEVGGCVSIATKKGEGTTIRLQLPLTLSLIKALLVESAGEPYAFPLSQIEQAVTMTPQEAKTLKGLILLSHILDLPTSPLQEKILHVVVVQGYGIIVDKFIGERDLLLQDLDPRLGVIPHVSCGAFMQDGSPLLVLDARTLLTRYVGSASPAGYIG